MTTEAPQFPPLFTGLAVEGGIDPFAKACAEAALGCDAGLVVHNTAVNRLSAAIVFAPEVSLAKAMAVLPVCAVGFQNALGALAPPEVAVHTSWDGTIFVNGAECGALRADASSSDPAAEPDWLVIGLTVPILPDQIGDGGRTPDKTALYEEGCGEVEPAQLLESWVRHSLVWLNRWSDEGTAPLHREWRGILRDVGEDVTMQTPDGPREGTFLGLDEDLGMLLRDGADTHLLPLTILLEKARQP